MKLEFNFGEDREPCDDDVADELERVAGLVRDGFREGELSDGHDVAGWWRLICA